MPIISMKVTEELYKALDDAEKRKLEKIKEKERLLAKKGNKKGELSEEEILMLIRRIILMRNLSKAERERKIKELMDQTGRKEEDLTSMMEVEQLREEAEQRDANRENETPQEVELAKPFSYTQKEEKPGGLYNGQVDDNYAKTEGSEFQKIVDSGRSELKEIRDEGKSEYQEIVGKDEKKKPSGPSY
jgi:hypothetical protein